MNRHRRIAVVTTSRADYAHLRWVLEDLRASETIESKLIVLGAPLSDEFGRAVDEIEVDGIPVDERIECLLSSDSDTGMAKTIGVAVLGLAEVLDRLRPDILLLIADRYELLAPASVALALRIPIAHIEGGEISEGAIDDAVRNALTKMAHIHFTPTEHARKRVIGMGEEPWRVHRVGAPSLDYLERTELLPRSELQQQLGMQIQPGATLVAYHPVTIARDTLREVDQVYAALESAERQLLFCFPNSDAGSRQLIRRAETLCANRDGSQVFVNLNPQRYWSLLRCVDLMLGNSSSGIMESASLKLPTVNIGLRQAGRQRAANIIDVPAECSAILDALREADSESFRASLDGLVNPYGDGDAARRIVAVLERAEFGESLLRKRALPLTSIDE